MEKLLRFALFIILLLSISSLSFSQNKEKEKYLSNFSSKVKSDNPDLEVVDFLDNYFKAFVLTDHRFTESDYERFKNTITTLVEKRHNYYPEGYYYATSLFLLFDYNKSREDIEQWHKVVDQLMQNRNPRKIKDFLQESSNFLYNGIIYEDPNFEWVCRGGDFDIAYNRDAFVLTFTGTRLICRTINRGLNKNTSNLYSDSIVINNTNGTADLSSKKWIGKGGEYTWEKVGLAKDETNALLKNYEVSLRATNLTADSIQLKTPYIQDLIDGKLIDRAMKGSIGKNQKIPFPSFSSYQANYIIKNIEEDIDYEGGFSLEGNQFIGIGNVQTPAKLTYYRNKKPFIHSFSERVIIDKEKIHTPMAKVILLIGQEDSITHTGLNILYNKQEKEIRLIRGESALTQAPFVDTYHQLALYVDEISWKKPSSELYLKYDANGSVQQRKARFESSAFYDSQLYQQLQGMDKENPLYTLYSYAYKYDKFDMDEGTAATALNRTREQAKPELLKLATLGFITYDSENGFVKVLPKTEHFVKSNSNKIDYDNISFTSDLVPIRESHEDTQDPQRLKKIQERNKERSLLREYGRINIGTLDMELFAVDFVTISNSKKTLIYPEENILVVQKNRKFIFKGWISSGKWEVKIKQGNYSYVDNKFNIFESDIAYCNVQPFREEDGKRPIALQSSISGIIGDLVVDNVNNRSGLNKEFAHYPILTSKEKTKVYYAYKQLYLGAYHKDRFFFELDPFEVDSLASHNDKALRFNGELVSAGIFPTIKEELRIMPDYSLGFTREAPQGGYPFYGTDAKYDNKIMLSNNGLQGAGVINFLHSESTSKRLFTFLPDSTIGNAVFVNHPNEQGVEFPDARGEDVLISYLPRNKTLRVKSLKEPIYLYDEGAKYSGTLVLKEKGMNGLGILDLETAKMASYNFDFSRWKTEADTASFNLLNKYKDPADLTEDPLAFKAENVNGIIDFQERKGVFKSNDGEDIVEFPVNKYICKIDQFTWLMDEDELSVESQANKDVMSIEGEMDFVGPNFFSTHPKQDSLQFKSPKANYNMKEKTIYAYETEFIEVADARIYPDSAKVVIRRNAKMDPFTNAEIVVNHISKYHKIINVDAVINARRAYTATGDYEYGLEDQEKQLIHLTEIRLDSTFQTVAIGEVEQEQDFKLSNYFNFYGKVRMKAANPYLTFEGATSVIHDCEKFDRNWMAFVTEINPENIQIPVSKNMVDLEGNPITAGILWRNSTNTDSVSLYPTFLSGMNNSNDPIVFQADGFLQYNEAAEEFQIGNKEKLINRAEKGNYLALHTPTCSLNGDGKIELGMDYGNKVTVESVGVISYNQEDEKTDMNLTVALRLPVDEKAFREIGNKINSVEGLNDADFASSTLEQAIHEWVNLKTADKIKSDYTLKKEIKSIPKEMRDAIVITGLRLTSHTKSGEQQRGLKTSSTHASIVNFFNVPVMKALPIKFFAEKRVGIGDKLGLLIEVPGAYDYYFNYDYRKTGIMEIFTNDTEFNEEIVNLKPTVKKDGRFSYDITESSINKSQFLRIFN